MKKIIFITLLNMLAINIQAQNFHPRMVYTDIDTLAFDKIAKTPETKDEDYLIELPKIGEMPTPRLTVAYNKEHTKAIVLHGYPFAQRKEYNVKDYDKWTVFYYKDKHIYCGYIYDKKIKACKYFEAINSKEKDKLISRFPFLKNKPTFTE